MEMNKVKNCFLHASIIVYVLCFCVGSAGMSAVLWVGLRPKFNLLNFDPRWPFWAQLLLTLNCLNWTMGEKLIACVSEFPELKNWLHIETKQKKILFGQISACRRSYQVCYKNTVVSEMYQSTASNTGTVAMVPTKAELAAQDLCFSTVMWKHHHIPPLSEPGHFLYFSVHVWRVPYHPPHSR